MDCGALAHVEFHPTTPQALEGLNHVPRKR